MNYALALIATLLLVTNAYSQTPWQSTDAWVRHTIDSSSQGADGVKVADINGDGRLDVVTGWEEGGVVHVSYEPARYIDWHPFSIGDHKVGRGS